MIIELWTAMHNDLNQDRRLLVRALFPNISMRYASNYATIRKYKDLLEKTPKTKTLYVTVGLFFIYVLSLLNLLYVEIDNESDIGKIVLERGNVPITVVKAKTHRTYLPEHTVAFPEYFDIIYNKSLGHLKYKVFTAGIRGKIVSELMKYAEKTDTGEILRSLFTDFKITQLLDKWSSFGLDPFKCIDQEFRQSRA